MIAFILHTSKHKNGQIIWKILVIVGRRFKSSLNEPYKQNISIAIYHKDNQNYSPEKRHV